MTVYILLGMDALMLVGGVWLLAHAAKTWIEERGRFHALRGYASDRE